MNDILLGPLERPAVRWLCAHMPVWVNPDMLTALGLFGGFIIAISYWLSNFDENFLWLVNFGFVMNWFGDALDGSLARYRKIERAKYGYFVDHIVDTFTQTTICFGLGLSPFIDFSIAMLALVGYLQLGILVFVHQAVTGIEKLSYGKIGPTEIRIIIMGVNTVFYFSRNPMINLWFVKVSFFNLIALGVTMGFFLQFIGFSLIQIVELYRQDPPKNKIFIQQQL